MTLPTSAISAGRVKLDDEGRNAITTPVKPMSTAVQRRQPTLSCSNGTDRAVTSSGEVKPIAEAVASGTNGIAMTNTRLLASISTERAIWTAGRRVASRARPCRGRKTIAMKIRCPVNRAQTICGTG